MKQRKSRGEHFPLREFSCNRRLNRKLHICTDWYPLRARDLTIILVAFSRNFGARMIASISAKELSDWIRSLSAGAVSRNTIRSRLSTLLNFARCQCHITPNPIEDPEYAKPSRFRTIQDVAEISARSQDCVPESSSKSRAIKRLEHKLHVCTDC